MVDTINQLLYYPRIPLKEWVVCSSYYYRIKPDYIGPVIELYDLLQITRRGSLIYFREIFYA